MKITKTPRVSNQGDTGFYPEERLLIRDSILKLAVKVQEYKKTHGKNTILVTGCSAGNGATLIAVDLAIALSKSGQRTLLVDADLKKNAKSNNQYPDFFEANAASAQIVAPSNLPYLDFVPIYTQLEGSALLLGSNKMAAFIKQAKIHYDYVIVDCAPVTTSPEASALFFIVDGIALVCSLNYTTKVQLKKAKSIIEPYADKYYGVVVNSLSEKYYKRLYM